MTRLFTNGGGLRVIVAGLVLSLQLLAGCGDNSPGAPDNPHLLLITLDACRADHLGAYGYDRPTSPFIDALASRGTVFSGAFINTHGPTASHTTILSGLYQQTHRVGLDVVKERETRTKAPYGLLLLPGTLRQNDYRAVAVTDGGLVSRAFGFKKAFNDFDDQGGGAHSGTRKLARMIRSALKRGNPVFAWYHTYEIHAPYPAREGLDWMFDPPQSGFETTAENLAANADRAGLVLKPEDLQLVKDRYDAGIRHTDRQLAWLFADLRRMGFLDDCVVVVTSAHGEEFGEHGGLLHRDRLYEELVRVPLIFFGSGVKAGVVDQQLAGSADIAPTVLSLLGIPVPEPMKGRELFGHVRPSAEGRVFIQYGNLLYALRTPRMKLIENPTSGRQELYDLYSDPLEQNNLVAYYPRSADPYHTQLEEWRQRHANSTMMDRDAVRLSPALMEQLRKLGE